MFLSRRLTGKIQIIPVSSIAEVMEHSLVGRKESLLKNSMYYKTQFHIRSSPASVQAKNLLGAGTDHDSIMQQ